MIVLGAGITGLVVAWKLAKAGRDVTIFEKESQSGGLAKTIEWDGFRFDNGGHNFFTKDLEILQFYTDLLPGVFMQRKRNFRLFIFGKLITFPFLGTEIMFSLKPLQMIRISCSFLWTRIKFFFSKEDNNPYLDEWIIKRYGKALYEIYFKPYLVRVQKCDPHQLSSAIGRKKIPPMSIRKMLRETFRKIVLRIPVQQQTGVSYYCRHGYGEMPSFFQRELQSMENATYRSGENMIELTFEKGTVVKLRTNKAEYNSEDTDIISTIPLPQLFRFSNPELAHLADQAGQLQHVSMRFFLVKVKKPSVTGAWLVNFNDPRMPFYRVDEEVAGEFDMVPEGYSSLTFEIPVNKGDEFAEMSDADLLPFLIERFNFVFSLAIEDVVDYKSMYCENANPRLITNYQNILEDLFRFILSATNLYSLGRQGLFTYVNLDHCTRMALDFSEYYLKGKPKEGNRILLNKHFHSGF